MPQGAFWRRGVQDVVGNFDESYAYVYYWEFFLRCAGHYALHRLNELLGVKRIYPESNTANTLNRLPRYQETIRFLLKNDALTERAILYYVVYSHPFVIEQSDQLRLHDTWLRSLLANANMLNKPIRFGLYGDSKLFRESGWSNPEEGYSWIEGEQATLRISIGPTAAEELILRARVFTHIKPGVLDFQTVGIVVNGSPVGEWRLATPHYQDQEMRIPRSLYESASSLRITFITRDAVSPASLGNGSDTRRLGVALTALRLDEPKKAGEGSCSLPTLFHITHQKAGSQWVPRCAGGACPRAHHQTASP